MPARMFPRSAAVVAVVFALVVGCSPTVQPAPSGGGDTQPTTGELQAIIAVLTSDAAVQARVDAATMLGRLGAAGGPTSPAAAEAVDHLSAALSDKEKSVRAAAARGLGGLSLAPGATRLLSALDDEAAEVRQAAQEGLDRLLGDLDDQTATGVLVDALDNGSATIRAAAVKGLGSVGNAPVVVPVLRLLDDTAVPVKDAASAAYLALAGRLPAAEVANALLGALDGESTAVRAAAASGLGGVGQETAVVPLLRLLDDPAVPVKDAAATGMAKLLPRLADTTAFETLLAATKGESAAVAKRAAAALRTYLAGLGPQRASEIVIAASAGDAWLAVGLGVPAARLAAETRRLGMQLEPLDGIVTAAAVAQSGRRVPGAHKYVASSAFHPAVVFGDDLAGAAADQWTPTALRFLEVVVTERVTWQRIQVCRYYGPDITRYRAVMTVKVISATTGKVVTTRAFKGADPRKCRQQEAYDLTELRGATPRVTPAITWLAAIIRPPK